MEVILPNFNSCNLNIFKFDSTNCNILLVQSGYHVPVPAFDCAAQSKAVPQWTQVESGISECFPILFWHTHTHWMSPLLPCYYREYNKAKHTDNSNRKTRVVWMWINLMIFSKSITKCHPNKQGDINNSQEDIPPTKKALIHYSALKEDQYTLSGQFIRYA